MVDDGPLSSLLCVSNHTLLECKPSLFFMDIEKHKVCQVFRGGKEGGVLLDLLEIGFIRKREGGD
jgi:hypothetical protein